jgi:hypothetical protein
MNATNGYRVTPTLEKPGVLCFSVTGSGASLGLAPTEAAARVLIEKHMTQRMLEVLRDQYDALGSFWIHYFLLDLGTQEQALASSKALEAAFFVQLPSGLQEDLMSFPLAHFRETLVDRLTEVRETLPGAKVS